jgi:hypothetical protein
MNPAIKAPIELGLNRRLDPDSNFPIVGGEYNENLGITDNEAKGSYLAQQASPHTAFLAKLSRHGKLPAGNISNGESDRDATRDVLSFLSGMGLYQAKLGYEGETPVSPSAVGPYESTSEVPQLSGRAAPTDFKVRGESGDANDAALKRLLESNTNTYDGEDSKDSAKGWIPDKYGKRKSGWIPNKYGKKSRRGRGSFGSYVDIMEILRRLKDEVDQGRVIDLEAFDE